MIHFIALILLPFMSMAKGTQLDSLLYTVKVQNGDRAVTFSIREVAKEVEIEMSQVPSVPVKKVRIGKEFLSEFSQTVASLPSEQNSREYCSRSYVMLTSSHRRQQTIIGCLGSPTDISRKLTVISNSLLFFM